MNRTWTILALCTTACGASIGQDLSATPVSTDAPSGKPATDGAVPEALDYNTWTIPITVVSSTDTSFNPVRKVPRPGFRLRKGSDQWDATDFIQAMQIADVQGSEAIYDPTSGNLIVKNTRKNLDTIGQVLSISGIAGAPLQIISEFSIYECKLPRTSVQGDLPRPTYSDLLALPSSDIRLLDRNSSISLPDQKVDFERVIPAPLKRTGGIPDKAASHVQSLRKEETGTKIELQSASSQDGTAIVSDVSYRWKGKTSDAGISEVHFKTNFRNLDGTTVVLHVVEEANQPGKYLVVAGALRFATAIDWSLDSLKQAAERVREHQKFTSALQEAEPAEVPALRRLSDDATSGAEQPPEAMRIAVWSIPPGAFGPLADSKEEWPVAFQSKQNPRAIWYEVSKYLINSGVPSPAGALAVQNTRGDTVAIRNTRANLDLAESAVWGCVLLTPPINTRVDIQSYECMSDSGNSLVANGPRDIGELKKMPAGSLRLINQVSLLSGPDGECKIDGQATGTKARVKSELGPDGSSFQTTLAYSFQHSLQEGEVFEFEQTSTLRTYDESPAIFASTSIPGEDGKSVVVIVTTSILDFSGVATSETTFEPMEPAPSK